MIPTKTILILSANPKDTTRLRLDEEVREIEEGLRRSKYREHFLIQSKWAVRLRDLRRAILDYTPQIVHFCGHGKRQGLMVENEKGNAVLVGPKTLANFFNLFKNHVECVLLNACYSEKQAEAINKHIDYVIGMSQGLQDEVAIEFVVGFYDALGAGKSVDEAFNFGQNAIQLYAPPQHLIPILKRKLDTLRHKNDYINTNITNNITSQGLNASRNTKGFGWDIFISHASEDKEEIARPLAEDLRNNGLKVWYDDFTLSPGDSLNRSINKGLRDSMYGIVILSPNFFAKEWPQRELDGLSARETRSGKVIVPIWHRINREEVEHFSPILADKLAIPSDKGIEFIVQRILTLFPQKRRKTQDKKSKENFQSRTTQESDSKNEIKETEQAINKVEYKIKKKDLISVEDLFQDLEKEEIKRKMFLEQQKAQKEYERIRRLKEEEAKRKAAEEKNERIRRLKEEEAKRKAAEEEERQKAELEKKRQIEEYNRILRDPTKDLPDKSIIELGKITKVPILNHKGFLKSNARELLNFHLSQLAYLNLHNYKDISGFRFLMGLPQIRKLDLTLTNITELSPLMYLTHLQILVLYKTQISDLSPLKHLTTLQALGLAYTKVQDLSPLAGLNQLVWLNLSYIEVIDISPLVGLENLECLYLKETVIKNLDLFIRPNFPALKTLIMGIDDITPRQKYILRKQLPYCRIIEEPKGGYYSVPIDDDELLSLLDNDGNDGIELL